MGVHAFLPCKECLPAESEGAYVTLLRQLGIDVEVRDRISVHSQCITAVDPENTVVISDMDALIPAGSFCFAM